MKKALHKDFWMEIKKTKARFISIFCIVSLGVAFFSGIQASSPDMRLSGDAYYTENKMMDLKVVGTLGLTEKDVDALKKVEGVEWAEGAWATDVLCGEADAQKVLHVESINKDVNGLTVTEGRLPEKSGECFLDVTFAQGMGYQIGDQMEFREDTEDPFLKKRTYTVTGVGRTPLYISFNRGNTTLGSGEVNGFAYVLPEDFDQEIYTQIYIRAHGVDQVTSYTDAYDTLVERLQQNVEGIQKERCLARYEDVMSEAEEKLADAEQELADGKAEAEKELADARKDLEDGEQELADGRKEYEEGKKQLADAREKLKDGRAQLDTAQQTIADGRIQLADARGQLASGWEQFHAGEARLSEGWSQYNSGKREYDAGKEKLEKAKKQLADGKKKLEESRSALDEQQRQIEEGILQAQNGITAIEAQITELNAQIPQIEAGIQQAAEAEAQLPALQQALTAAQGTASEKQSAADMAQSALDEAIKKLEAGEITEEELVPFQEALNAAAAELEAANGAVAQAQAALDTCSAAVARKPELEAGLAAAKEGIAQAETKKTELALTIEQLQSGRTAVEEGRKKLEQEGKKLQQAEKEISANEKKLAASEKKLKESLVVLQSSQAEIDANRQRLNAAQAEINANEQKLADGEAELVQGRQELADGEAEIKENQQKLIDAEKELADGEAELEDGWKEYRDGEKEAEQEIADGEKKIADARKEIQDIEEPEWIITDRNALPEYSDYGDNADRIKNIGEVFPVIFFLVAALISLTTMTRMVEEQRTQIGTLKALGYGKYAIASKYLNYAFLATVGGSAAGILIGEKILPYIIIKAYGIMYHNVGNNLEIHYELKFALTASVAAVVCTVGATVFACYKVLAETPASLMRPPAPKEGKRVLVEKITILWKHLNFTWKSCLRNLFRYKKRLFMTIFGISGSMALMLVGFGIKDSISDIVVKQYEELQHYDGTIITDEDASPEERTKLSEYLKQNKKIQLFTNIQFTKITAPREKSNISCYLYVPEDMENFREDVTLRNRITKEGYELTDAGAVISEKTARLLGLQVGDSITLEKDHEEYQTRVAVITENYMGHYIYMTPAVYEQTFGEKPVYEDVIFSLKDEYLDQEEAVGKEILSQPAALSISYTASLAAQVDRMLSTLGIVIVVLIVSAGMLAFVVLYNLNNINITERQRELATLKVLGFYDKEVSQYVLRENILLTIAGIIFGSGFGVILHRYIIVTVEVDAVMFGRNIRPVSFLYCAVITCIFSLIVNLFMHRKLKKIDMVESLKSVE
ncbi:MAG: FtsX-like permease family protein [Blautia sp.]|uniref:FtsX-like permease family protein n=1 Tax=Blautia sp. TaxID=1955243 RepID=UPI002A75BC30|nr:FtsX-like permease family protein [Blautia sp.]MDY3017084.1 FtsX-like permease family protein [Blautia sp.]